MKQKRFLQKNMVCLKVIEMNNITSDKVVLKRGDLASGNYIVQLKGEKNSESKMLNIEGIST